MRRPGPPLHRGVPLPWRTAAAPSCRVPLPPLLLLLPQTLGVSQWQPLLSAVRCPGQRLPNANQNPAPAPVSPATRQTHVHDYTSFTMAWTRPVCFTPVRNTPCFCRYGNMAVLHKRSSRGAPDQAPGHPGLLCLLAPQPLRSWCHCCTPFCAGTPPCPRPGSPPAPSWLQPPALTKRRLQN